jgi:hypothetical protein
LDCDWNIIVSHTLVYWTQTDLTRVLVNEYCCSLGLGECDVLVLFISLGCESC